MTSFVQVNRGRHEQARLYPNRFKQLLRDAMTEAGLKNLEWEKEFAASWGPVWYDAAFTYTGPVARYKGKTCVVFIYDQAHCKAPSSPRNFPFNWRTRQHKLDYAREVEMPYCEIWPGPQDHFRATIERWLMTIDRVPYREAGKKPPYLRIQKRKKDMISRYAKIQRLR